MPESQNPYESPSADGIRGTCTSDSEVEFEFTLQDWSQFVIRETQQERTANIRRVRLRYLILVVGFSLLAFGIWLRFPPAALPIAVVAVFYFYRAVRVKKLTDLQMHKNLQRMMSRRSNAGMLGRQTVTLTSDGFETVFPAGSAQWKWWAIPEILVEDDYLFIYLSAADAKTIPARAFASQEHFQAFVVNARRLWEPHRRSSLET